MGVAREPEKVKLFVAILFQEHKQLESVLKKLVRKYGATDYAYGPIPFVQSTYYNEEMGEGLQKAYFSFAELVERADLPKIKVAANRLEAGYAHEQKRCVNIDPGYLSRDKLVLASTKDFFHRVYLRAGIFGEVTLHFRKGKYRYFSWTYPDYREPTFCSFLEKARARLVKQLRELNAPKDTGA